MDDSPQVTTDISRAVELLAAGNIVAIPTETVYGLAANALDPAAVQKIYDAKGRPATNPLIVHVADIDSARCLTTQWTQAADKLARAFWPGPLTLVLPKASIIPPITTASGDTVAIRMPSHPLALKIIEQCKFPLAAPSANRSNAISPTTAQHVATSLGSRVPLIIDGGPCTSGIESTVLNLATPAPEILRPGSISAAQIEKILGIPIATRKPAHTTNAETPKTSPGQLPIHYAPDTPMILVDSNHLLDAVIDHQARDTTLAVMTINSDISPHPDTTTIRMPANPDTYGQQLYATLHDLDRRGLDIILCELPPADPAWTAIRDRLTRAGRIL